MTYTDEYGHFTIKAAKGNYTIVVSHTGLQAKERVVSLNPEETIELNIDLTEDSKQLAEVIVNARRSSNVQPVENREDGCVTQRLSPGRICY